MKSCEITRWELDISILKSRSPENPDIDQAYLDTTIITALTAMIKQTFDMKKARYTSPCPPVTTLSLTHMIPLDT